MSEEGAKYQSDDLPEPKAVPETPESLRFKRWRLFKTINWLLFGYALLHKLLIPVSIHFLRQREGAVFSEIDWWWFFHGAMAIALMRRSCSWVKILSVLGACFTFGKLGMTFLPVVFPMEQVSWNLISVLMTEGFTFVFCMSLLFRPEVRASKAGWLRILAAILLGVSGALLHFYILARSDDHWIHQKPASQENLADHSKEQEAPPRNAAGCGVEHVDVSPDLARALKRKNEVSILPCGFKIPVAYPDRGEFRIRNESGSFLNIRVQGIKDLQNDRWHFIRNIPVFEGKTVALDADLIQSHAILKVVSDSWKEAGILVLVGGGYRADGAISVSIDR